jgi:hypothetical protein
MAVGCAVSLDKEIAEVGGNQSEIFMDSRQNRALRRNSDMKAFIIIGIYRDNFQIASHTPETCKRK